MLKTRTIYGGTFDPVHLGHLACADEVQSTLGLKDFRFLPAGDPPHRTGTFASAEHRLRMLELALGDFPGFSIDTRELTRAGPSWMTVTLQSLREEYPDDSLLLLLGQDAANGLERWHDWHSLFGLTHLVIMSRPGETRSYGDILTEVMADRTTKNPADLKGQAAGLVYSLPVTPVPLSSSLLRKDVNDPVLLRERVPESVADYIELHALYR